MIEAAQLIQATISEHIAPDARVVTMRQRATGEQGFSGATLRYYDVAYQLSSETGLVALVTKDAPLSERRTHMWLSDRHLPVPFASTLDLTTDAPASICMQFLPNTPTPETRERIAASALAAIHAAAMGRGDDLPWLPRADRSYFSRIVANWRDLWHHALEGPRAIEEYASSMGYRWGIVKQGGDFAATFGADTRSLADTAARFLEDMDALWDAGNTLTLIHADFHGEHLRTDGDRGYVIDWGQAHYGSLYLDLPNYFSRNDALRYRDALADLGYDIPRDLFLARHDAVNAYPGFKYFGFAFRDWFYGDSPHQPERVRYWINMVLQGADKSRWR